MFDRKDNAWKFRTGGFGHILDRYIYIRYIYIYIYTLVHVLFHHEFLKRWIQFRWEKMFLFGHFWWEKKKQKTGAVGWFLVGLFYLSQRKGKGFPKISGVVVLTFYPEPLGGVFNFQCDGSRHMHVSENSGTPKSSHFNRVFQYKPSILGVLPLFLETPKWVGENPPTP